VSRRGRRDRASKYPVYPSRSAARGQPRVGDGHGRRLSHDLPIGDVIALRPSTYPKCSAAAAIACWSRTYALIAALIPPRPAFVILKFMTFIVRVPETMRSGVKQANPLRTSIIISSKLKPCAIISASVQPFEP